VDSDSHASLLERLCLACREQAGVREIAVSVVTAEGHRGTAYASSELAGQLEDAGFVLGEGPGSDALSQHAPILVTDLSQPEYRRRWPSFSAAAAALGVGAVFVFPLEIGAVSIGTLTLYDGGPTELDALALAAILRAADDAVLALLGALSGADTLDGVDDALYRSEVHQASGMLAEQLGISVGEALIRLRAHAFATDRRIDDVARSVILRELRFGDDNDQGTAKKEPDYD
jgi:hypothetical protein